MTNLIVPFNLPFTSAELLPLPNSIEYYVQKLSELSSYSLQLGATRLECTLDLSYNIKISCEQNKLEKYENDMNDKCAIRMWVGNKHASAIFNSYNNSSLAQNIIKNLYKDVCNTQEDPLALPPSPSFLPEGKLFKELQLYDNSEVSLENALAYLQKVENSILAYKDNKSSNITGRIKKCESIFLSISKGCRILYDSSGWNFIIPFSEFDAVATAIAENTQGDMESDTEISLTTHWRDLIAPELLGKKVAEKTLAKLNTRPIATQEMPVIFNPEIASSFVEEVATLLEGKLVADKISLFSDSLDKQISNSSFTLIDDPLLSKGLSSTLIDDEYTLPQRRAIIDEGKITGWFLDQKSARRLNLAPTGNGVRGLSDTATSSYHNLTLQPTNNKIEDIINSQKNCLLITSLMGDGFNMTNGVYSKGAYGLLINNGHITHAVSNIAIASNIKDMLINIVVADDLPQEHRGVNSPSLLFKKMMVSSI